MKKRVFKYLLVLFVTMLTTLGGVRASRIEAMSSAIAALGRYEVEFEVVVNGDSLGEVGRYEVDGEQYHLSIATQEVYGDGEQRCSVDHANREVVLERVESQSVGSHSSIIVNPARAFDSLTKEFEIETLLESEDNVVLKLTPRSKESPIESTLIELNPATNLPRSVSYLSEGDVVLVKILEIISAQQPLKSFQTPEGYEVIDIR